MKDYMIALQRRFQIRSERTAESERKVSTAYDALYDTLNRDQQKLLLRLADAEADLHDEEMVDAFFSGFRLADGIHKELNRVPPYSCDDEDETCAAQ